MGKMSPELASQKKELGHAEERTFNAFFGNKNTRDTNFSNATADNYISNIDKQIEISNKFGGLTDFSVSLKSGVTWQFHLGRIEELSPLNNILLSRTKKNETKVTHSLPFEKQVETLKKIEFWKKYLGKGNLLCYNDKEKKYTFFLMSDVINFLIANTQWRILETGRLKGDLKKNEKLLKGVLTFEYRAKKKQFAIGAMAGNNGFRLFEILKSKISFHEVSFQSEIINNSISILSKNHFKKGKIAKIGTTFFDSNYLYICIDGKKWKKIRLEDI